MSSVLVDVSDPDVDLAAEPVELGTAAADGSVDDNRHRATRRAGAISRWFVVPVLGLSVLLNGWALTTVGWGNGYYSAAVRSMAKSWKAFLFAGFDRAGFVTVDKPPFSLWVQTLSVKIFGFSKLSVLIPQVIGGALAVWLLYLTIARVWGRGAGLVAAAALAVTPINVMVNHSNNTDSTLVLLMTAAAYLGVRASQQGSWRWLVGACAVAGTAMTAKMLAAIPVMPGIVVAYAWCAPVSWRRRVRATVIGLVTLAVAGLWWFTLVDVWPTDSRPYVGSSASNSAYQLAFERNGVSQVEGGGTFPGGGGGARNGVFPDGAFRGDGTGGAPNLSGLLPGAPGTSGSSGASAGSTTALLPGVPGQTGGAFAPAFPPRNLPAGGFGGRGGPGGTGFGGGQPGLRRLFNSDLGGQAGWLIVPALLSMIAIAIGTRLRPSARLASGIVFGGWLASAGAIFSITKGIVHPYYLASLGPPAAGLVGVGAAMAVRAVRRRSWWRVALFVAGLVPSVIVTADLVRRSGLTRRWAVPALVLVTLAAVVVAVAVLVHRIDARIPVAMAAMGVLFSPFVWTRASLAAGLNAGLPYASPDGGSGFGGRAGPGAVGSVDHAVIDYLKANRHGERFLVATSSAMTAEAYIIKTGEAVMAMGGFSGSDPILTDIKLRSMIAAGEVRFFALGGFGGPGGFGRGGSTFVTDNCPVSAQFPSLYDCKNLRSG